MAAALYWRLTALPTPEAGPLPWLPHVPHTIQDYPAWGNYLAKRATRRRPRRPDSRPRNPSRRSAGLGSSGKPPEHRTERRHSRVAGRPRHRPTSRPCGACPRCAAGRAASNSAGGDDVVERDQIVEGDSRSSKLRIAAARVRRNQLISTRRVAGYTVYLEGPAVVSGRGDRCRPRVNSCARRHAQAIAGLLRLGHTPSLRSPNNDVGVGRKDQR
jgi:hypothetical protein